MYNTFNTQLLAETTGKGKESNKQSQQATTRKKKIVNVKPFEIFYWTWKFFFSKCRMFTARMLILNLFVYLTILLSYVGYVFASPCYRVPQGTGAGKSEATGNFRIRISGDPDKYRPGRQYTGKWLSMKEYSKWNPKIRWKKILSLFLFVRD